MYNNISLLVLFSLLVIIFQAASKIVFKKFRRDAQFDDYRCVPGQTLFERENTSNAIDCAKICYQHDFCYSFFYLEELRVCFGCDGFYHNSEVLNGSKYFGRYSGKCTPGWVAQRKGCYFFGSDQKNFTTAQMACRRMGGELVEVNDDMENDYLRSMLPNGTVYWIGLKENEQGQLINLQELFVWISNGKPPEYDFFRNTSGPAFKCHINNDGWTPADCNEKMNYICERSQFIY